jgi:hypothetical protein
VDQGQLLSIASSPDFVFTVSDFLALVALVDQFKLAVCVPPTPPVIVAPPMTGRGQTTQELPPARCNDATNSGGAGITARTYDMGTRGGTFTFSYNTYSITDKIEISYEGRQVFSTNGLVGESKEVSVSFGPGSSTIITVVVTGKPTDTATPWDYVVRCPGSGPTAAAPAPAPAATSGAASVTTDKRSYRVGESIRICYSVPGPGPITLTDITPDGRQAVLLRGNDDGRGDCFTGTVALPAGTECFRLDYQSSRGSGTTQTCIMVAR